jgi:hypothetical protein
MTRMLTFVTCAWLAGTSPAHADVVAALLQDYAAAGAGPFSTLQGERLWVREQTGDDGKPRSCTSCHTADLKQGGRHAVTGKTIEPLAPSANPKRLAERRKIEKWLARNCKWTLGRECTAQEKGDLLSFLQTQ